MNYAARPDRAYLGNPQSVTFAEADAASLRQPIREAIDELQSALSWLDKDGDASRVQKCLEAAKDWIKEAQGEEA